MKKLLTSSCALLSACSLFADTTWFATIEVDSIQALRTGVETFCKAAELSLSPLDISDGVSDLLENLQPLPLLTGSISTKAPLRAFVVEGIPPEAIEIALTFTLQGEAKALEDQLAKAYGKRDTADNVITFTAPVDEDNDLSKQMLLSVTGDKALLASSKEVLAWYRQQEKNLSGFLPVAGKQALRACVSPKALTSAMPPLPPGQPNLSALLNDLDYLSIALNPDAQAFALTYGVRAKTGSVLAGLLGEVKAPDAALWNGLPGDAFFALAYASPNHLENTKKFFEVFLQQPFPTSPALEKYVNTMTGESVQYLAPTKDKKSLRWIAVSTLKDAATARESIKTLDQVELSPGVKYKKEESRQLGQQTIERYSLDLDMKAIMQEALKQARAKNPDIPDIDPNVMAMGPGGMMVPMLTKGIIFELTVKDNYLISAASPAAAADDWLPALPFPAAATTLDKKLAALDPAAKPLLNAGELRLIPLFKHIISMFPNAKPAHVNLFETKTDPIQFWTTRTVDNTTVGTIRVPANEIAAFVKVAKNGQEMLQELFVTLFAGQMMQQMMPPAATPPPNF